jgi:23S rRNA (pseudouridine1915-N3)-methyltransferase
MRLRLIAVGTRMPEWVTAAAAEYARRLPREWRFDLVEVPVVTRGKNADIARACATEGERQLRAVPVGALVIAFDEHGRAQDSAEWARAAARWQQTGRDVCLLIGGPDGLAPDCRARADQTWSLSKLTLPHGLVRVLVLEQLYRAWSLNSGHPYHRA